MSKASFQAGLAAGIVSGMRFPMVVERKKTATYLTFTSAEPFTIGVNNAKKNWDGLLYYSTDTTTWNEWNGATAIQSVEHSGEQRIYMRGSGNSRITGSHNLSSKYNWVLTGANIKCTGNIENLLDYQTVASGKHPTMASNCYNGMFKYCTSLITAPELPATTLSVACYYWMFCGCTNLITPPALPATTLANDCYAGMFQSCTNLITPPALPATTLATWCYSNMFTNCKSLVALPALPATTLTDYCYNLMFFGCSKIKIYSAPTDECTTEYRIPTSGTGTTADRALNQMFYQTGGLYDPQVDINTTYYTSNTVI